VDSIPTAGAILAGGRARRFDGRDKSRLEVHGRPIIVAQIEALRQVCRHVFIVSPHVARFADLGLPVHPDRIAGAGAIGGVYTALECAQEDLVIAVACDQPFLHPGLLRALVTLTSGHDAAWVQTPRGAEPLLACYRRTARHLMRAEIEAGRLKAANVASVLRIARMDLRDVERFGPADRLLANVNTPEEYSRVKDW
jgi:molybdopterin-guanine dinucleotide biosynthesis protein A